MAQRIEPLENTPLNRLFLAINHYISTGDHLGEGMAVDESYNPLSKREPRPSDRLRVVIPYNITDDTDLDDLAAFKSRLAEVGPAFGLVLEEQAGHGTFGLVTFVLVYQQAGDLAAALTEKPGPAGWGSMKPLLDQHGLTS